MHSIVPNTFAYLALVSWPLISAIFYLFRPFFVATVATVLFALLLLPSGAFFKFQMIPQLDKETIPSVCVLVALFLVSRARRPFKAPIGVCEVLIACSIIAPVVTSLLNSDPVRVGYFTLPGVGIYDGLSAALFQLVVLVPFLVGRLIVKRVSDLVWLLRILAFSGLMYSAPLLFEIRFSPQLHAWVYGFYPSDFIQAIRDDGGFRPMVFFSHGLPASFFLMTSVVAAAALWRFRSTIGKISWAVPTVYLGVVLMLCKSGAALVYGALLVPLVRWVKPRLQLRIAVVLALVALTYPATRILQIFPTSIIVDLSESFNPVRASSLKFRFDQEDLLLNKAFERPLFGWGRYGRNRIYGENWLGEQIDTTVTDGRWIITFGQFGIVGFLVEFGLLAFPIWKASTAIRRTGVASEQIAMAAIALIVAINMIELLPNSTLGAWTWLMAGCLLGGAEAVAARARSPGGADPALSRSSKVGVAGIQVS